MAAHAASKLRYLTVDVFTDKRFGGNPLAVFPDATSLNDRQMQLIARELNLSETAYVLPAAEREHTFSLRIFTPTMELPFAGHPTVGSAIVLAELGLIAKRGAIVFAEGAGPVAVMLDERGGMTTATLTSPKLPQRLEAPAVDAAALAALLGLTPDDLGPVPAQAHSAGVPYLFVPVKSEAALAAAAVDLARWRQMLAGSATPHLYVPAMDDWARGHRVHARMFAPAMGIAEDPATGAAVAALPGLLCDVQRPSTSTAWTIDQGREMGRPSRIDLSATIEGGKLVKVEVGGTALIVSDGAMFVDPPA